MDKRKIDIFKIFLILSLFLHILFISFVPKPEIEKPDLESESEYVVLEEYKDEATKDKQKLVDLIDTKNVLHKRPRKTDYLSDRNRTVDEEMQAKVATNVITPPGFQFQSPVQKQDSTQKNQKGAFLKDEPFDEKSDLLSRQQQNKVMELFPKTKFLAKNYVPYDPNYLKGLKKSDVTLLNTKTFLYSSYWTRIKRKISNHWKPQKAFRKIYGQNPNTPPKLITTNVHITLSSSGHLQNKYVKQGSGYSAWDTEAIDTLDRAGSFPNPPKGLVAEDGTIDFNFTFIGEASVDMFYRTIR